MDENENKIIKGRPAKYPSNSTPETESRNIFQNLIDVRFVKGEIRVLDKYPNSDGILEILDADEFPIGKIDIQLKTLAVSHYSSPGYSCDEEFFSYCENTTLPVILIVVNRQDKIAYWRHIDRDTLLDVAQNIKGKTYFLRLPLENCLDGKETNYLNAWRIKAKEPIEKVWNFEPLKEEKLKLEKELEELKPKLQEIISLPAPALKEIYNFIDDYNYILDKEFKVVKQILYPEYWKIGIGIMHYERTSVAFTLFPVKFSNTEPLIKKIINDGGFNLMQAFLQGKALLQAFNSELNIIKEKPLQYSYQLLESEIFRVVGKYNFPIPDDFVAHEYLVSFIDRYHGYLGIEKDLNPYSLKVLKHKLYNVLPALVATTQSFAKHVTENQHNIDGHSNQKNLIFHNKALADIEEKLANGFTSPIKVTITSELYNINLIAFYIHWLEKKGVTETNRKYLMEQYDKNAIGVVAWKTWHVDIVWENIQIYFSQFYRLFEIYLNYNFPYLKNILDILPDREVTTIHLLMYNESQNSEPYIEIYHLRPFKPEKGEMFFYKLNDPENPIDRSIMLSNEWSITFQHKQYTITRMQVQTIEFLFTISPTYALMNERFSTVLKQYFREKQKD